MTVESQGAPVSRTVVPEYADPVAQARAELKAALWAIEEKANVPKRVAGASERAAVKARRFARRAPVAAALAVVAVAAGTGVVVWAVVNAYTRPR